ncbi:MAG: peptide deformylase [Planctomycetota bacterium]|jgi:peptide deformylase|nr:peptide deformylase [Planctomycetota bacterium]MDP6763029.1 peptide deformylase [Planctomycetota bacterium]MDP6988200.1 peptide deformylase [Planctomycetota bacterium]
MSEALELQLTLYPQPVLRKRAVEVEAFDADLGAFVDAMFGCMRRSGGVGLAAPQVGDRRRVLVLNPTGKPEDDLVLINPEIVDRSGPITLHEEGCLSFPGIYAEVRRPDRCRVTAVDAAGAPIEATYEGFTSRVVQHEFDHLEGVLLVDRMSPADKLQNRPLLEELVERYRAERTGS